jgi:uncharacterized protein YhjY with autotransporter beta-barrel domain
MRRWLCILFLPRSKLRPGRFFVWALLALTSMAVFSTPAFAQFSLTLQPNSLPPATQGAAYSVTITAIGGTAPYTFVVSSGTLPAGLTLTTAGVLSGTPTASGTPSFQIQATDPGSNTGFRTYTLDVGTPGSLGINPATLPNGFVGTAYNQTLTGTGGTGPYTFSITSGALPNGLTLSSAGVISGTPTTGGPFNFTVGVNDSAGNTGSQAYTVNIGANILTVLPASLPNGLNGTPYSQTITASGGTGPYTFVVSSGALPAGLSLSSGGVLSGTPSGSGPSTFTVLATDSVSNTGSRNYTITIGSNILIVAPSTLPNGTQGTAYSQTITASGGTAPYSFAVTSGALPTGLSLSSGGVLSGTPSASGPFTFTVQATDPSFNTGSHTYNVTINLPPLTINPASLPAATAGTPYSQTVAASGGTAPYSYAVFSGALPTGLSLAAGTGVINGTPTTPGAYSFTIQATDATPNTGTRNYTINVGGNVLAVAPAGLPNGTQGTAYSQTVTASGGTGPYTFTLTAGALPTGLTLSAGGVISGTPSGSGVSNFTVGATDTVGNTGSHAYSVTIGTSSLTINPASLPPGMQNVAYSQTVTGSGGTGPYTFALLSGTLPTGLTISSGGVISGTPTGSGLSNFTVGATDTVGNTGSHAYSVNIGTASLTVNPASLPNGTQGTAYNQTVTASGGTGPYTFTLSAGALPAGLTLSSAGVISGTPTGSGVSSFTVRALDSLGNTGTRALSISIGTVSLTVNPASLPPTLVGHPYSQIVSATGGTAPYTFSIIAGALPPGLTLNPATGVISGTPTSPGAAAFTVQARDVNGNTGTRAFTLSNRPDPALDPDVQGLIAAQVASAQRFASAQADNIARHLESLHGHFNPCSVNFGLAPPIEQNPPSPYPDYVNPNSLYSPNGNYGRAGSASPLGSAAPPVQAAPRRPGEPECSSDWASSMAFWTGGSFQFGSMAPNGVPGGNHFTTAGVTAGVDIRVSDTLIVGAALGMGADRSDVGQNGTRSNASSFSGALYASLRPFDPVFFDAALGYGTLGYDNRRFVSDDGTTVSGARTGSYWFGTLEASYEMSRGQVKFAPYVRTSFISATLNGYGEGGPSAELLNYAAMKFDAMSGALGLRGSIDIPMSFGVFSPTARFEYKQTSQSAYDQAMYYSDLGAGTSSTFSQPAGVYGMTSGALGFRVRAASGLAAEVEYGVSQGTGALQAQTIRAALRMPF